MPCRPPVSVRPRVWSSAVGLLLLVHAGVRAADADADAPEESPPTVTLNEVVVKGEKSDRTVQDTTSSVAVTTSERIEQENLLDLYQVFNRTANVGQTYGNAGFTIRGIQDQEGGGFAPLATIYLDGAALPQSITASGPASLWDIAQVEILRGPQSTIQGENALAGAVVMRSEDPTMDWSGRVRALWSDPTDTTLAFAGGGPLIKDELAFRVSYEDRDFDGFIRNVTRRADEDAFHGKLARAKLLWTPTAVPGLEVRLGLTWYDRPGPYQFSYARLDVPDPFEHRYNFSDTPNRDNVRTDAATLQVDYKLSDAWALHSVSAWNRAKVERSFDTDLTEEPLAFGVGNVRDDTFSQELRLSHAGDRLDGLLGLYFSRHRTDIVTANRANVETPATTISQVLQANGLDPATADTIAQLYVGALPVIPVDYHSLTPSRAENKALFGDGEFRLTDRFSLLGGFRYDRQSYAYGADTTTDFIGTLPDPSAFGPELAPAIAGINQAVLGYVAQAAGRTPSNTRDFDTFLPKLGLRYAFADDLSASFVVQRGYRSGGSSFNVARNQTFAYDPEYTWNYEFSLRSQWLDRRLGLNANFYYIDWKDKQVTAYFGLNDYDYNTVNAGRAHLYGFELEATHYVGLGFDWYASLGYSRTRYDDFRTVSGATITDYSGSEFAYAPHWTLGLGANWRFGDGWFANLNANFRDAIYGDIGADPIRLSSRTLVNGRFGYAKTHWSAWLFANNLLDEEYIQYRWATRPNAILGAPRVVGVGAEYRW